MISAYKRSPAAPTVGLITPDGVRVDEHGEVDSTARAFTAWETVRRLTYAGRGQALCWNNEEIRWRTPAVDEPEWTKRDTDVHVVRVLDEETPVKRTLAALKGWRNWLAAEGATPAGTTGSAAWSLLRATVPPRTQIWLRSGELPPFKFASGGRIELAPGGRGEHRGAVHYDLPAAYASTLGGLRYSGRWFVSEGKTFKRYPPEWWAQTSHAVFVHARVRVPELPYGPLLERQDKPGVFWQVFRVDPPFPTYKRLMHGVWTWQELETAMMLGCKVERVYKFWVHAQGWDCFAGWWAAVQRGRALPGLTGALAKATGNATWGRFALDATGTGRTMVSTQGKQTVRRKLSHNSWVGNTDYALAETVAGIVRARLTLAMHHAGDRLITAHTDGLWVKSPLDLDGWRQDREAAVLRILEPQIFQWRPQGRRRWFTVYAGQPRPDGERLFAERWAEHEAS